MSWDNYEEHMQTNKSDVHKEEDEGGKQESVCTEHLFPNNRWLNWYKTTTGNLDAGIISV